MAVPFENLCDQPFVLPKQLDANFQACAAIGPNYFANQDFRWWQRQPAGVAPGFSGVAQSCDNVFTASVGTTYSFTRVPLPNTDQIQPIGQQAARLTTTSVAGANNYCKLDFAIEGARTLYAEWATFSTWICNRGANDVTVIAALWRHHGTGGAPSAADVFGTQVWSIPADGVFRRFAIVKYMTNLASRTFGSNLDERLIVSIYTDAGNNLGAYAVVGQKSSTLDFARAGFNLGKTVGFAIDDNAETYRKCLRYFNKSFAYDTQPSQNFNNAADCAIFTQSVAAGGWQSSPVIYFPVPMRKNPTVTLYNPNALNAQLRNLSINADWTVSTTTVVGYAAGFYAHGNAAVGSTTGNSAYFGWTAEAGF